MTDSYENTTKDGNQEVLSSLPVPPSLIMEATQQRRAIRDARGFLSPAEAFRQRFSEIRDSQPLQAPRFSPHPTHTFAPMHAQPRFQLTAQTSPLPPSSSPLQETNYPNPYVNAHRYASPQYSPTTTPFTPNERMVVPKPRYKEKSKEAAPKKESPYGSYKVPPKEKDFEVGEIDYEDDEDQQKIDTTQVKEGFGKKTVKKNKKKEKPKTETKGGYGEAVKGTTKGVYGDAIKGFAKSTTKKSRQHEEDKIRRIAERLVKAQYTSTTTTTTTTEAPILANIQRPREDYG